MLKLCDGDDGDGDDDDDDEEFKNVFVIFRCDMLWATNFTSKTE